MLQNLDDTLQREYLLAFSRLGLPCNVNVYRNGGCEAIVHKHRLQLALEMQLVRQRNRNPAQTMPDMPHKLSVHLFRFLKRQTPMQSFLASIFIRQWIQNTFSEPKIEDIVKNTRIPRLKLENHNSKILFPTKVRVCIQLHVGHREELFDEFVPLFENVRKANVDVRVIAITTFAAVNAELLSQPERMFTPATRIINDVVPNQGFDILPFLHCAKTYMHDCDIVFKWHTKSDVMLRHQMHRALFGTPLRVLVTVNMLCGAKPCGLVGPENHVVVWPGEQYEFTDNWAWLEHLTAKMRMPPFVPKEMQFVANTIFAVRMDVLQPLLRRFATPALPLEIFNHAKKQDWSWFCRHTGRPIGPNYMEHEYGLNNVFCKNLSRDGMCEHAIERMFGFIACRMFGNIGKMPVSSIADACNLQLLAIYFPQFHAFETNDMLWGKGFTEWTMLLPHKGLSAVPLQKPLAEQDGGCGVYDLTQYDTRKLHADMAAKTNMGFFIYHYWFGDTAIMDQPLLHMLKDGQPDRPFAFQWANEQWTKRWDGMNRDVLVAQEYGDETVWHLHWEYLLQFFRNKNYIKVDGRPVFVFYRFGDIPKQKREPMLRLWQSNAVRDGFGGMHFVANLGAFEDSNAAALENPLIDSFFCFQPMYSNGQLLAEHMECIFPDKKFDETIYLRANPHVSQQMQKRKISARQHLASLSSTQRWLHCHRLPFKHADELAGIKHSVVWEHSTMHALCTDTIATFDRTSNRHCFFGTFDLWNNNVRRSGETKHVHPVMFIPFKKDRMAFDHILRSDLAAAMARHLLHHSQKAAPCFFIFNAWNEWNEQAVLEPDHIHKSMRLNTLEIILREAHDAVRE
jgi:lipopolysaccharide biosynthesis protein